MKKLLFSLTLLSALAVSFGASANDKRLEDMSIAELRDVIGETRRRGEFQTMDIRASDRIHGDALRIFREKLNRQTGFSG